MRAVPARGRAGRLRGLSSGCRAPERMRSPLTWGPRRVRIQYSFQTIVSIEDHLRDLVRARLFTQPVLDAAEALARGQNTTQ